MPVMSNSGTTCLVGVESNMGVKISRGFILASRLSGIGTSIGYGRPTAHVEHKQCARHIFAHFMKKFTGLELKNFREWGRRMFQFHAQRNKEEASTYNAYGNKDSPYEKVLSSRSIGSQTEGLWTVMPSGGDVFETMYGYNRYKVDLTTHTCTYNLWMLSGITCVHSQATINYIHKDPTTCGQKLSLLNHYHPHVSRMPGRSKLKRVKHASESQDAKYLSQRLKAPRTVRCGKCQ
uniref:Zinc finger PMZ-type domain-containing protein n=1 Tax=Lactuca sativa TaxID=4236 RepID=A0A9R1WGT7_LACSA|nr:hypothetical protein LSAT_V11C100037200 [Lactuca sativa]